MAPKAGGKAQPDGRGRRAVAKVTVSNVVNLGLRALRRVAQQHSEGRLGKPLWPVRLPDGMEVPCARASGATT